MKASHQTVGATKDPDVNTSRKRTALGAAGKLKGVEVIRAASCRHTFRCLRRNYPTRGVPSAEISCAEAVERIPAVRSMSYFCCTATAALALASARAAL
jgi:hypothetical protein